MKTRTKEGTLFRKKTILTVLLAVALGWIFTASSLAAPPLTYDQKARFPRPGARRGPHCTSACALRSGGTGAGPPGPRRARWSRWSVRPFPRSAHPASPSLPGGRPCCTPRCPPPDDHDLRAVRHPFSLLHPANGHRSAMPTMFPASTSRCTTSPVKYAWQSSPWKWVFSQATRVLLVIRGTWGFPK